MSIIRVAKRTRFTTVDRETVNDERLSFRARGVLQWLLDKPDDWECRSAAIAEQGTEGRDAVRTALRELEELGYLVRTKRRDPTSGQFFMETLVYERPAAEAEPRESAGQPSDEESGAGSSGSGEPGAGNPDAGKSGAYTNTENEDCKRKDARAAAARPAESDEQSTDDELAPFEADFNRTWKHYPRKEARKAALKQYQRRRRAGDDPAEIHKATQVYRYVIEHTTRTVMLGSTFFGPDRRWKDFLDRDEAMAREQRPGRFGQPPPSGRPQPGAVGRCSRCDQLDIDCKCEAAA